MGDFWPPNIIVSSSEVERVYVVDWEVCRPGPIGIEIGQFCADIEFVQHFHPEYSAAANAILTGFMREYSATASPDEAVLRMADVHAGVHTVVIGARVEWGGREATRKAVSGGMQRIVRGSEIRREWAAAK